MSNCIDRMWLLHCLVRLELSGHEVVAVLPEVCFVWVRSEVLERSESNYIELFLNM